MQIMKMEKRLYTQGVMIHKKDQDNKKENENIKKYNFQGNYARSKHWFDLDHKWLEEWICTLLSVFLLKLYQINIMGQAMKTYQFSLEN